jgi:PAS domain S-box-containing protein
MLAGAIWALTGALENSTSLFSEKILWSKLSYLGITSIGPIWLMFTIKYAQYKNKNNKNTWLIWIFPIITLVLVATNNFHGLIWPEIHTVYDNYGNHLIYKHGAGVYFTILYSYLFLITGITILINYIRTSSKLQKQQGIIIILGLIVPWIANLIYNLALPNVFYGIDLTPVALTTTGVIIMLSVFKYDFLKIIPIAKEIIYQNIAIGIILINKDNQIIDFNNSSKKLLDNQIELGIDITSIKLENTAPFKDIDSNTDTNTTHHCAKQGKWLNIKINTLNDADNKYCKIILIEDITERQKTENYLKESRHFFSDVTDFLPDPTFVLNKKREIVIWNKAMEKLTGISAKDMIGKNNYEHAVAFYGTKRPMLVDLILDNNPLSSDWKLYADYEITKDGHNLTTKSYNKYLGGKVLLIVAQPLFNDKGEVIYGIESTRDITELEKHNEKIHEKMEELSKLNNIMVNREMKMMELKQEIAKLKIKNTK